MTSECACETTAVFEHRPSVIKEVVSIRIVFMLQEFGTYLEPHSLQLSQSHFGFDLSMTSASLLDRGKLSG